jgi:DNA polymerase-1
MLRELKEGLDMHSLNQEAFKLPSRLIAKVLNFRVLYGGTEFSFVQDPDFNTINSSPKFWRNVLDAYYDKYKGIARWHNNLVQEVTRTGRLRIPSTGRLFTFKQYPNFRGELEWPVTQIKNFPVQGTGNDLMAISRVNLYHLWKKRKMSGKLISTVHDSIVADVPDNEVVKGCQLFLEAFDMVPNTFHRLFGVEYDLPFKGEVQFGPNLNQMEEYKP